MIRTLRITSVIVAIAAVALLILLVVVPSNRGTDPKIEEFLKMPSVIDKFAAAKGQHSTKDESQTSPLVKSAAAFSQLLNPPPPPPPPSGSTDANQTKSGPAPSVPVAVKFDLVGTSFYATKPEMSLALINEPGKGLHWVKQGGSVGHLLIERVGDGIITVRDGQRTSDMTVKVEEPWRKLLKNPPPETRPGQPAAAPVKSASATAPVATPTKPEASPPVPVTEGRITAPSPAGPGQSRARPGPSAYHPRTPSSIRAKSEPPGRIGTKGSESSQPVRPGAERISQQQPAETKPAAVASPLPVAPPKSEEKSMADQLMADLKSSQISDEEAANIKQLVEAIKELDEQPAESADQPAAAPSEQGSNSEPHPDANKK